MCVGGQHLFIINRGGGLRAKCFEGEGSETDPILSIKMLFFVESCLNFFSSRGLYIQLDSSTLY